MCKFYALEICDLDLLSARREVHCLNFAHSLLKSERTKMLIPLSRQEIRGKKLRNITSLNYMYVCALTDSLKAPYPTTLACLITPSLPSWWLLHCPYLCWCGYWPSLLFTSAYFLLLAYCAFCDCLYDAVWPLGCSVKLIKSYHIIYQHNRICMMGKYFAQVSLFWSLFYHRRQWRTRNGDQKIKISGKRNLKLSVE